jgi:hypothetical protein
MIPASHHGRFAGVNRLWFRPGTPAHVSDGTLVVAADRVAIAWVYEGAPKEGALVLRGPGPACRGDFTDSFHASSGMVLHGNAPGGGVLLYATYPAGEGLPDWGWRITLDWCDPDHFTFRMFNVLPDGAEALAVDLRGARVA